MIKKPETRIRGTQFDLPKPSLSKKGTVFILSEDQIPKKRIDKSVLENLDKILDNYDCCKDINALKENNTQQNSSKNFVWGYPKKNPNAAKKYYSKKNKK